MQQLDPIRTTWAALRFLIRSRAAWLPAFCGLFGPLYALLLLDLPTGWLDQRIRLAPDDELSLSSLLLGLLFFLAVRPVDALIIRARLQDLKPTDPRADLRAVSPGSTSPWRSVLRDALTLLFVALLRSLLLLIAALSVVLLPPVLTWLCLADAIAVGEQVRNPLACLLRSKHQMTGYSLAVFLCLMPLGLPLLGAKVLLFSGTELPTVLRLLVNLVLDVSGCALTAVSVEIYLFLKKKTNQPV